MNTTAIANDRSSELRARQVVVAGLPKLVELRGGAAGSTANWPYGHDAKVSPSADVNFLTTEEQVAVWNGLLEGRFGLLRTLEFDGFRLLLVEERTKTGARSAHASLKRRVLRYAATGYSTKYIAIELGLSPSTVAYHVKTALAALGLSSRSELLRVLHMPMTLPAQESAQTAVLLRAPADTVACRLDSGALGSPAVILLAYALPAPPSLPGLSAAESKIVHEVLAGRRNKEIARGRGTSVRTVANQIGRAFRKLGVGSRAELCALAAAPVPVTSQVEAARAAS